MGTITKALDLLNLFSPARPQIGLGEVVRLTGRDKATLHRHLSELEENGFLEQHPVTRAYRLGPALLRLAAVREAAFPMRALLRPIVTELSEAVGELAHASLLQGDVLSPVFHADPRLHGTQVHFDASEVLPLHATSSGLAVLAFAPDALRRRILARPLSMHTGRTITDPERLRGLIDEVRRTGISRLDGAFDEEVASQGVPLFGEDGRVIGAISVAVPTVRDRPDRQEDIARHLRAAARAASLSLGAREADLVAPDPAGPAPQSQGDRP
jgi:DNA-binding IclR family transcriptional regulator